MSDDRPDDLQLRELDLDRREQSLADEERALDTRWNAHERRWKLLEELQDYLHERETTLRARAERLGVGQDAVDAALATGAALSQGAGMTHVAVSMERASLTEERERLCTRREVALQNRRELLDRAERQHADTEEAMVLREQQLADAFRRLVRLAGEGAPAQGAPVPASAPLDDGRRRSRRIEVNARVGYGTPHNFYAGETANIGVGGLFIATENLLQVGRELALNLDLPEAGTLSLKGEVAWRRPTGDTEGPAGLGIRFVELQGEMRSVIERFVEKRAPDPARE